MTPDAAKFKNRGCARYVTIGNISAITSFASDERLTVTRLLKSNVVKIVEEGYNYYY